LRRRIELANIKRGYVDGRNGQIHYAMVGDGPPLLLVHQSAQSWRIYARLANILASEYRVIAMDLPGFGESDPLPPPFQISDIAAVATDLLDGLSVDRVRLSGHHTGAMVTAELAASHPERVSALAISGYPYRTDDEREGAILELDRPRDQPPAPRFTLKGDGSHLLRVFERMSLRRWQGKVSSTGAGAPLPSLVLPFDQPQQRPEYTIDDEDLELINESIVDNLRAAVHGGLPTNRAVTTYDPHPRLPQIKAPTLLIQSSGPFEGSYMQRASMVHTLIPQSEMATIENGDVFVVHSRAEEYGELLLRFFRHSGA
jgi:pimeloyl-ACP methyl ester carboxylesterase